MNSVSEESARAMDEWLRTVERDEDAREDFNQWIERHFIPKVQMKLGKEWPNGLALTEANHQELGRLEKRLEEASMRRRDAWVRVEESRMWGGQSRP